LFLMSETLWLGGNVASVAFSLRPWRETVLATGATFTQRGHNVRKSPNVIPAFAWLWPE
jgi:hypothetical protein